MKMGLQKAGKVSGTKEKQLEEHFVGNCLISSSIKKELLRDKLWNNCRIIFLWVQSWISHHVQYIISSKGSENLEKSLCAKGQGRKSTLDTFNVSPSGSNSLITGMVLWWKSLHGLKSQKSLDVNIGPLPKVQQLLPWFPDVPSVITISSKWTDIFPKFARFFGCF